MNEFKKCSGWHIYNSNLKECPYCNGKKLEDDLENLPPKEVDPPESAMCYDMGPGDFENEEQQNYSAK